MYRVFKRSCRNWQEFSKAKKIVVQTGLSYDKALQMCQEENQNLTPAQERAGTKYEFEKE